MVLCGGRGTRLRTSTESVPKPLVEIGGRPVVWHVVMIYAAQGFKRFELLTGHKGSQIADFAASCDWPDGVEVSCTDTGEESHTGERVRQAFEADPCSSACITYADGLSDIDLSSLVGFHAEGKRAATITLVRPRLPFGVARVVGDEIEGFTEKPISDQWINGGFMVFGRSALESIRPGEVLEQGPLERLAANGELGGFRHEGFWFCMDTYKEQVALNDLWEDGKAPWAIWT